MTQDSHETPQQTSQPIVSSSQGGPEEMKRARAQLFKLINTQCGTEVGAWLSAQVESVCAEVKLSAPISERSAEVISALGQPLLEARRIASKRYLIVAFAERDHAALIVPLGAVPIGHWRRDEAVKIWLISEVVTRCAESTETMDLLYQVYDATDTEGRVACLRSLNFLGGSVSGGLKMIHDAGRTYLSELMEAGWCHSPFASRYLSDEEYRKAVLKSLFCDVPVSGFMGLEERADAELARSLCEYADEREAAGRVVPSAVLRVAAFYPQPGLLARLIGRLEHPTAEERLTAAIGLERTGDPRALSFIQERVGREENREVSAALERAVCSLAAQEYHPASEA